MLPLCMKKQWQQKRGTFANRLDQTESNSSCNCRAFLIRVGGERRKSFHWSPDEWQKHTTHTHTHPIDSHTGAIYTLQTTHILLDWGEMGHLEKSQSTRQRGGGGGRRRQWWEVHTIAPPEADKLLSSDCCWPPEMAVNSCIILFLHSPPVLSSPLHPPHHFTVLSACLFVSSGRWHGLVLDHDESGRHLGTDTSVRTKTHTNNGQCVCACVLSA